MVASALLDVADGEVGASGTVAGVTGIVEVEAAPVPAALVAVTVNVYEVPFVSPVTVIGEEVPVPVPPGLPITVYVVMVEPPSVSGAPKETVASASPPVAVTEDGASETVIGMADTMPLGFPCPAEFTAEIRKLYAVPFVSPVTIVDVAVEVPSAKTDHTPPDTN
jgi:hypothetical protein